MEASKVILADIAFAIRTRNFKNLNSHSKRILILSIIVLMLFCIGLWLMSDNQAQINEEISQSYEKNIQEENKSGYIPPKIEAKGETLKIRILVPLYFHNLSLHL